MAILVLVSGTLKNGQPHYAYASIPPSRYQAFKQAEADGDYDLAAYGTILAHGEGATPPEAVKRDMEKTHGANHYFEDQLEAMLKRAQAQIKPS